MIVNFYADPFAVKELLIDDKEDGIPKDRFVILPLDITTPHELPFKAYLERVDPTFLRPAVLSTESGGEESINRKHYTEQSPNPIAYFTSAILRRTRKVMRDFGKDAMEYVIYIHFSMQYGELTETLASVDYTT